MRRNHPDRTKEYITCPLTALTQKTAWQSIPTRTPPSKRLPFRTARQAIKESREFLTKERNDRFFVEARDDDGNTARVGPRFEQVTNEISHRTSQPEYTSTSSGIGSVTSANTFACVRPRRPNNKRAYPCDELSLLLTTNHLAVVSDPMAPNLRLSRDF